MKSIPVDDLPDEYVKIVTEFTNFLRKNMKAVEEIKKKRNINPSDFHEGPLGVKEPLTRKEIYEDV